MSLIKLAKTKQSLEELKKYRVELTRDEFNEIMISPTLKGAIRNYHRVIKGTA